MLFTKETDYALRILRVLSRGARYSVPEICKEEQLPTGFAYKIVQKLTAAGALSVTRGADGGCLLEADLNSLSLYDVMEIMGEAGLVAACMAPEYHCTWRADHHDVCSVHCQLIAIQNTVNTSLKQQSVASLLSGCAV